MSVSATTFSRLVKMFSATTATISTISLTAKPCCPHCVQVGAADVPTLAHDRGREMHRGVRFRVAGRAIAVQCHLLRGELRQVQAQIGVRRKAVIALVCLRHGQSDPLACLDVERLAEGRVIRGEALQYGGWLLAISRNMLGTMPSCFCTASSTGLDASGTSSRAGIGRRDMRLSSRNRMRSLDGEASACCAGE